MRNSTTLFAILVILGTAFQQSRAQDEIIVDDSYSVRGVPIRPAVLTRRYSAVETEEEVAAQELEAGCGTSNFFTFVHFHRYARPYYGWYGFYGPRYYVGYAPGFYYPGFYGGFYGGYYGYRPAFAPYYYAPYTAMPYYTYYAPGAYYGNYPGCFYW